MALYAVAVAGLTASLTLIFLAMRAVMDIGGYCAEGGPYVIETHCPPGVPLLMVGAIFGLFLFGGLTAWKGSAIGGPYGVVVLLAWPALLVSLGWNFLEYALRPPPPATGIVLGWLIPGIVFVLMGGGPLLALLMARRSADPTAARARLAGQLAARAKLMMATERPAPGPTGVAAVRPSGGLVDELERLAQLRRLGSLSADEFELAKRTLLDGQPTP
ncbi:hypothetical protein BH24CHL5_BH24CHL5_00620 [soil metagenome]